MCMLCDEEAFYRAYLEHKAKVEAQAREKAPPADAVDTADRQERDQGRDEERDPERKTAE